VAHLAIRGEAAGGVVRIRSALEVRQVAGDARRVQRGELPAGMANAASQRKMRSRQRKRRLGVIKSCAGPGRGAVADRAIRGEACGNVVRVGSGLELLVVAGETVRGRCSEVAASVALRAGHAYVGSGQREFRCVVVERCRQPRRGVMALLARLREAAGHVIGVCGLLEIRQVAR